LKILIVEDEPKTAAYARKGLTEHGFVVDVAENGTDGSHLALTSEYDLVVLDVMLPGIDGWTVLRSTRSRTKIARASISSPMARNAVATTFCTS